jgi:hypothetical protein
MHLKLWFLICCWFKTSIKHYIDFDELICGFKWLKNQFKDSKSTQIQKNLKFRSTISCDINVKEHHNQTLLVERNSLTQKSINLVVNINANWIFFSLLCVEPLKAMEKGSRNWRKDCVFVRNKNAATVIEWTWVNGCPYPHTKSILVREFLLVDCWMAEFYSKSGGHCVSTRRPQSERLIN